MMDEIINQILNFAINREKEAIEFYKELQNVAKFAAQKELLHEFELMEQGHVNLLESAKKKEVVKLGKAKAPQDLHLNDFLVEAEPTPNMSYQDIIILAIKKEQRSIDLYEQMYNTNRESELGEVFKQLLNEEQKHKHHFEVIYDDEILSAN